MAKEKLITLSSAKAAVEMEWQNCSGKYHPDDIIRETCAALDKVPTAPSESGYDLARVLAEVLDGSPLVHPCAKLPHTFCKAHCIKVDPDAECWMQYAEAVAAEREEDKYADERDKALPEVAGEAKIKDHANGEPVTIHVADTKRLADMAEMMKKLRATSCEKV